MFYSHNNCLNAVDTIEDGPTTVCLCPVEATPTTSAYLLVGMNISGQAIAPVLAASLTLVSVPYRSASSFQLSCHKFISCIPEEN